MFPSFLCSVDHLTSLNKFSSGLNKQWYCLFCIGFQSIVLYQFSATAMNECIYYSCIDRVPYANRKHETTIYDLVSNFKTFSSRHLSFLMDLLHSFIINTKSSSYPHTFSIYSPLVPMFSPSISLSPFTFLISGSIHSMNSEHYFNQFYYFK